MRSAFATDAVRSVKSSIKRFLSIAAICLLGVTTLVGLTIACEDLRLSADEFFDEARLYDVCVQSTLGLGDEDVAALAALDGVEAAEGSWSETAYTEIDGTLSSVAVHAWAKGGMNEPYITEGRLPQEAGEVAVTAEYLEDTGKRIGDTLTFGVDANMAGWDADEGTSEREDKAQDLLDAANDPDEELDEDVAELLDDIEAADVATAAETLGLNLDDYADFSDEQLEDLLTEAYSAHLSALSSKAETDSEELFARRSYTIVASVIDPTSTAAKNGSSSFRATGARYSFFVSDKAATQESYSVVYLRASGAAELSGFSSEYQALVDKVTEEAESIKDEREAARPQELRDDANEQIDSAEASANKQFAKAEDQIAEAQQTIDDALAEIAEGWETLESSRADAYEQLDEAQAQLDSGRAQLVAAQQKLDDAQAQIAAGEAQLPGGQTELDASRTQLDAARDAAYQQLVDEATKQAEASYQEALNASEEYQQYLTLKETLAQTQEQLEALKEAKTNYDELTQQKATLEASIAALEAIGDTRTEEQNQQLAEAKAVLEQVSAGITQIEQTLAAQGLEPAQLDAAIAEAEAGIAQLQGYVTAAEAQLAKARIEMEAQLAEAIKTAWEGDGTEANPGIYAENFASLYAQLDQWQAGITQLASAKEQLAAALATALPQLESGWAQIEEGEAQLAEARAEAESQLADAEQQLTDAEAEVADGQAELDDSREEFEREKAEALQKIADARAKLDDIGEATWYVQDRSAISSYSSIDSDASSIEVIGTVFPAIFLTVAILMSLTTATRMVEEDRGLIGLFKALGYSRGRIMGRYVAYTVAAAALGGLVGSILGFVALPYFLFSIFEVMYTLPAFTLHFSAPLCALAVGMFIVGIGAATALTVRGELTQQPAQLMRPKAPRAGTRILLEHVTPIWSRLSFLNKVTARNLFRYKRRLAMTVFGVAGCCALMIVGYAIADSVLALCPNQYGGSDRAGVYAYDLMAVTQPEDLEAAAAEFTADAEVESYVAIRTENVVMEHSGAKETVQLVVVPDGFSLEGYIDLRAEDGSHLSLDEATAGADGIAGTDDDGVLATKNASTVLAFGAGAEVSLQDTALNTTMARVDTIVMNYLGNAVYMSESTYERLFGCKLEANALIAQLAGDADAQIAYKDELARDTMYLSVTSIQEGIRDFSKNFMLINYVVVLLVCLAAALSFVVLFTLSSTNISERERELATIKVLGFRRREVRTYIYKELMILALIGTLVGAPLGGLLGHALTYVLNMPSMYFAVEISPVSYLYSCGLSLVFAVVVCVITSRTLDRIDMVGALKSAE